MSEQDLNENDASTDESYGEKTIVERDEVVDLKLEVQSLKATLELLMKKMSLQPAAQNEPTKLPQSTQDEVTKLPLGTSMNESSHLSASRMPLPAIINTLQASRPPMQNKISTDKISMPHSFHPGINPRNSATYMPTVPPVNKNLYMPPTSFFQPCTFMPSSMSIPTTISMQPSSSAQTNVMPQQYTTNLPPPSTQPLTTSLFSPANNPTYTYANNTQYAYEHRPIRKLYDLPEFDGQPEHWPMFAVSYKETSEYYQYTNLENLSRLQRALKGDAKAKVEAYLIHPDNVNQVMETLEFHFGRPQLLIRSQISKVRAYPQISGRKMSDIVDFSTMVANLTIFLVNAGASPHLCNPTLLSKLPLGKREEWMRYSINNLTQFPDITQFSVWLQEVATYVSLATETDNNRSDPVGHKGGKSKMSLAITTEERRQQNCPSCQHDHHLYQCTKFKNLSTAQRWKIVKDNHLCFSCLRVGHPSQKCVNRRQCGLSKCPKYHNRLLHEQINKNIQPAKCQQTETLNSEGNVPIMNDAENDNTSVTTIVDTSMNEETLFKFLPVELRGPKCCMKVIAFIDDGSKISLLEESVAETLGLQGLTSNLSLGWIGGKRSNEMSKKENLEVFNLNKGEVILPMRNVRTTKNLTLPPQTLNIGRFRERFPVLREIIVDDYFNATPKLLIGLPHIGLVRPHGIINLDDNFSVHETKLGNILFGSNEESTSGHVCVIDVNPLDDLHRQVSEYFTLESFGMKVADPIISDENKKSREILENNTVKKGFRYETGHLWRQDDYQLKESFSVALKRLQGVEARMQKDTNLATWYKGKILEYVSKSYARKLSQEESLIENGRTWYLPHFAVTNVNKGNKRRLVFDAAATVDGESFNSRLMKGPCEYQPKPLLSILFRFRQRQIGVCADIREMFHRVKIREQDQTAQRFLWRDGDSTRPPEVYVMQVMIFGSVCSPCSAQYVKNLNGEIYKQSHPRAYGAITENHYVDDYVDSFDSADEAIVVTKQVIDIHQQAGFELTGFVSNSEKFCNAVVKDQPDVDPNLTSLCRGETMTEKILGLFWMPKGDQFCFMLKFARVPGDVLDGRRIPTKSEVLSLTMSIFDPFGFLANVVIPSKILLQELWRCNIDWSSPIPEDIYEKWYRWYREIQNARFIKIPRCYGPQFSNTSTLIDLHIFVDASELAFSAVGYWRICYDESVDVVFVAGKSKCAPLKPLSIPRLELQAAVLGVRLKGAIISSHDIKPRNVIFWSDSKTEVQWIQSDCRVYKQFVARRIAEILDCSEVSQWKWVPGAQNPADDATRTRYFSGNLSDSRWLNGPSFLRRNEEEWPQLPGDIKKHACTTEMRSKFVMTMADIGSMIPYDEGSKYYRLLRVRCWIVRAVKIFKCQALHQEKSVLNFRTYLTVKEIADAEIFWCKIAQQENFSEEYNSLSSNKAVSRRSPIFKLSPFLAEDGLIRVAGRINNAACIDQMTKEPVIMPKDHLITRLIVKQFHEDFRHQNQESICAAIRTMFWIPSLRRLVRSAKGSCQECKNRNAVPKPPMMGQLPIDKVSPYVRPFTYSGIDYLGPFIVSVGRRSEKRWIALFTCLTVRAIHLEMAKDLSTDAVILCIRNFINRRGVPIRIRSDRGTNFIGASKEEFVIDEAKLADECTRRGVEWIFNTPANPSAGGVWERMVRCVKNVLAFTLHEKSPQVETLNSLLIEAENLVNSRPLTHLPIENSDSEPLTPNHFLLGCPNIVQTPAVGEKVCLRKQWHILQQLKQTFWKRWMLEYLPDLTRRTKWYQPVEPIKVGDVVVICDDNETRGEWKRGIILEVLLAADGQVRSAVVRTSVGKLRRPASKLAVLDVRGESP